MSLNKLKEDLLAQTLFTKKNDEEYKRVCNLLDELFSSQEIEEYYLYSEYDILEIQDYLIIWILVKENLLEIDFNLNSSRIDCLALSTIKRFEATEYKAEKREGKVFPPAYNVKLYHDVGIVTAHRQMDSGSEDLTSLTSVSTIISAEGNEILKLKKFTEKIRKKVFGI